MGLDTGHDCGPPCVVAVHPPPPPAQGRKGSRPEGMWSGLGSGASGSCQGNPLFSRLLRLSLSQPCPSPPASHIAASEFLAPPRAAAAAAEATAADRVNPRCAGAGGSMARNEQQGLKVQRRLGRRKPTRNQSLYSSLDPHQDASLFSFLPV